MYNNGLLGSCWWLWAIILRTLGVQVQASKQQSEWQGNVPLTGGLAASISSRSLNLDLDGAPLRDQLALRNLLFEIKYNSKYI